MYLSVYAPSKPQSKLPVFVYIQGGGFNSNSNPNLNGTGLVKASQDGIIVVTFNYRVGPFGFLASSSTSKGLPTTNNGLRDQRKVFQWVKSYIAQFGGDPDHVTIGGPSAGAASVSLHLTAYGGRDDKLFHAAAAESVSFATVNTASEAQYQYDNYARLAGCTDKDPAKSLSCLRSKRTEQLLFPTSDINIPYSGQSKAPLYMFAPSIDGDIITELTYNAFAKGHFIKVPVIIGADTNDGRSFAPTSTSNQAQSNAFLTQQFPALTTKQLTSINALYPTPSGCSASNCWYRQLSDVYGDMRYMCPGLYISSVYANPSQHSKRDLNLAHFIGGGSLRARAERRGSETYLPRSYAYRYNVEDADQVAKGLGVPHTAEVAAIFGPDNVFGGGPKSYSDAKGNGKSVNVVQQYWASFIKYYDPNVGRAKGSAEWKTFGLNGQQQRMLFDSNGETSMEIVASDQQKKCAYLQGIGPSIKQR